MRNLYIKPMSRDLSTFSIATGACASGLAVGTCTATAGGIAGSCVTNGTHAGTCSSTGQNVTSDCVIGSLGSASDCRTGLFATPGV